MYSVFVVLHNLLRWAVVILGIVAVIRAGMGWFGKKNWTDIDRKLGIFFSSAVDLQLLTGLILYLFLSEYAVKGMLNYGIKYVMSTGEYRLFAVEHVFFMVLAIVLAHLGSALPKKATDAVRKHRLAAIFFALAVILILAGMPWARPLLPGL